MNTGPRYVLVMCSHLTVVAIRAQTTNTPDGVSMPPTPLQLDIYEEAHPPCLQTRL